MQKLSKRNRPFVHVQGEVLQHSEVGDEGSGQGRDQAKGAYACLKHLRCDLGTPLCLGLLQEAQCSRACGLSWSCVIRPVAWSAVSLHPPCVWVIVCTLVGTGTASARVWATPAAYATGAGAAVYFRRLLGTVPNPANAWRAGRASAVRTAAGACSAALRTYGMCPDAG